MSFRGEGVSFSDLLTAVSGVGAAIAAFLSWRVSVNTAKSQSESLNELKRKNQLDLLYLHAMRANDAIQGINHSDWIFWQYINVMRAIKAAIRDMQTLPQEGFLSQKEAKEYFKNSLDSQILHALQNEIPPDGAFSPPGPTDMALSCQLLWEESRAFLLE